MCKHAFDSFHLIHCRIYDFTYILYSMDSTKIDKQKFVFVNHLSLLLLLSFSVITKVLYEYFMKYIPYVLYMSKRYFYKVWYILLLKITKIYKRL